MLQAVPDLETVRYGQERFPKTAQDKFEFEQLFAKHGLEVRGRLFGLDYDRYHQIESEGRLVWIVARSIETNVPVGYACAHWYRDLNFPDKVAADGLWYVHPAYRTMGIGKTVKLMCHAELKKAGVVRVYDVIRNEYNHPTLMQDLGYEKQATRWAKEL